MNKSGITKVTGLATKQILEIPDRAVSFSAIIGNTGVVAGSDSKKVIPAGTPIGGSTSILDNAQAVMTVTNTAELGSTSQGVLLYDVDVTAGNANGTICVEGYVNVTKSGVTPVAEAKTALANKIKFLAR